MAATAYLAGVIDGEGCLLLHRHKDKKARTGYSFSARLSIASKDRWFLESIQQEFGGVIDKPQKSPLSGNAIYALRFRIFEIRKLLPALLVHLRLKKLEAIKMCEALSIMEHHRERGYDSTPLEKLVDEIKALKKARVAA